MKLINIQERHHPDYHRLLNASGLPLVTPSLRSNNHIATLFRTLEKDLVCPNTWYVNMIKIPECSTTSGHNLPACLSGYSDP